MKKMGSSTIVAKLSTRARMVYLSGWARHQHASEKTGEKLSTHKNAVPFPRGNTRPYTNAPRMVSKPTASAQRVRTEEAKRTAANAAETRFGGAARRRGTDQP